MIKLNAYKDLQLTRRAFDLQTSNREYVNLTMRSSGDVDTTTGRDNLVQAVINRLLTRKGELTTLGHPEYGSRLHELVGELNNLRIRVLAEIYIRDSLKQELRIEKVHYVTFLPPERGIDRHVLKTTIGLKAIGETEVFSIPIPINI